MKDRLSTLLALSGILAYGKLMEKRGLGCRKLAAGKSLTVAKNDRTHTANTNENGVKLQDL